MEVVVNIWKNINYKIISKLHLGKNSDDCSSHLKSPLSTKVKVTFKELINREVFLLGDYILPHVPTCNRTYCLV